MTRARACVACFHAVPSTARSAAGESYGQELVDQVIARHPGLARGRVSCVATRYSGLSDRRVQHRGRIGKLADEDDMRVNHDGKDEPPKSPMAALGSRSSWCCAMSPEPISAPLGWSFRTRPAMTRMRWRRAPSPVRDWLARQNPFLPPVSSEHHPYEPLATTRPRAKTRRRDAFEATPRSSCSPCT